MGVSFILDALSPFGLLSIAHNSFLRPPSRCQLGGGRFYAASFVLSPEPIHATTTSGVDGGKQWPQTLMPYRLTHQRLLRHRAQTPRLTSPSMTSAPGNTAATSSAEIPPERSRLRISALRCRISFFRASESTTP